MGSKLLIFFVFLCCPIVCHYVPSSVLWCPLRFPHENDVRFIFVSSFMWEDEYLICDFCASLRIGVSSTYCVVVFFCLFSIVLCTLCCQFLWIVHFWLPLRYSLTFIKCVNPKTHNTSNVNCIINLASHWSGSSKYRNESATMGSQIVSIGMLSLY